MRQVFVTCFAFLITLNIVLSLSSGSSQYNDRDEIYTTKWKRHKIVSPLKKRLLGTFLLQKPTMRKWTMSRQDWSKQRREKTNGAISESRDTRFKRLQDNIRRDHSTARNSPLTDNHGVGFVDRKPRPRSSLHKKEIERFKEVLRKRTKVKPRQEIEVLDDNQDSGARQNEFESPRYEEVTANDNSENGDQNSYSNNYVTVIDNMDGKNTDSYSTLSSDEAKNEYTNVENSIGEGANEESQLLGKEVNDVLGALTKADSRLNQDVGAKSLQPQGELSSKQAPSSYSDKGDDVEVMNQEKEAETNSQNRPPGDITVIEDNEDANPNEETTPILSKPVWDVIQQVEKNYTYQNKIVQSSDDRQSEKAANETYAPTNFQIPLEDMSSSPEQQDWPIPERLSESRNVTRPSHALSYLEDTLKMFDGSNTRADYFNTTKDTEDIHTKGGKKLFLTGSAEEGTPTEGDHLPVPSQSTHFDRLKNGDSSKVKLFWYNQNGRLSPKADRNSFLLLKNLSNEAALHGNKDNFNIKPWNVTANEDNAKIADQKDKGDQNPDIGMPFSPPSGLGGENDAKNNSGRPGITGIRRPTNDFVNSNVHLSEQKASDHPVVGEAAQSYLNDAALKIEDSNINNFNIKPWNVNPYAKKADQKNEKDHSSNIGISFLRLSGSGIIANNNESQPGGDEIGRASDEFVSISEQNVSDRPRAKEADQSYLPTKKLSQGTTTPQDDVTIIETEPASLEPFGKFRDGNKMVSFQGRFTPQSKADKESEYTHESQSNKHLELGNGSSHFSGFHQGASTLPWELGSKGNSLYQMDKPSTPEVDSENQTPYSSREPEHTQPAFIIKQDDEQNPQQMKDVGSESQLGVPLQVNRGSHSLESWSKEYQNLNEKLTNLYGHAHGNSSRRQSAIYRNNPALNASGQMMKEVTRFPPLSLGGGSGQKGIGGSNGKFFKDLKGDVKVGNWGNTGQMNTNYPPYMTNKDHKNNSGAYGPKLSVVRFQNLQDVVGNVRSIPMTNQTLVTASNSSNLQTGIHIKDETNGNHTEKLENGPLQEHKETFNFVNQTLASRLRSTDSMQLRDTSDTLPSNHDGPSSHQVLMSYFGNETDLRKRLHPNDNTLSELQNTNNTLKDQEIQFGSDSTSSGTESVGIKTKHVSLIYLPQGDGNHTAPDFSKQVTNNSKEENEQPLTKYLEDFINLVSSGSTAAANELNGTTQSSSEGESSSSAPKSPPETVILSEAAKKENVTDLKNRLIIVVSPKSLRDLMKNRSHNSSQPVIHKGIPVTVNKAKNYTVKNDSNVNKTMVDIQGQSTNSSANTTIQDQVSQNRPPMKIVNNSSNEEKLTAKGENDDLDMLYRDELKSLEISLSRDFMSSWIYYQRSFDQMGITPSMLRSGIANLGSPQRLKRVFKKALAGTDLNVLVVGGSISAGGGLEKDRGNVEGVYHKAFSDWWNNTVTPITASQLKINAVAIGGTDSEYFSYCIKNYMRTLPDIVVWELAANDYKRYDGRTFAPAKPLEQLIRIILSLPSNPALILANFFRGNYYKTAVGQDCPDSEDEGGKSIAQYYKLTSLSWRNVICSQENDKELDLKKLFSSDGYHPSLLGHAQMSALLISYVKGVFEQTISQEMILLRNRTLQSKNDIQDVLPSFAGPMFDDPVTPRPLCWTLLTPDYDQKLRNTLPDLEFTEATGFQFANISHWPIRRDRLRCLKAIQTGAMLKMKFNVPSAGNKSDYNDGYKKELAVTTHNSFGGLGTLWLDGNQNDALIIQEQKGQRRTQVDVLTRKLTPGVHTVTVYALQPGFCLSAVAVL